MAVSAVELDLSSWAILKNKKIGNGGSEAEMHRAVEWEVEHL